MSRIGKIPVPVPSGVTVTTDGTSVAVKGPKGELKRSFTGGIRAKVEDGTLRLDRPDDQAQTKALHGLYRSLCKGMIDGVLQGYEKRLEIVGVSYQAALESGKAGPRLKLQVGFANPVFVPIPKGLDVKCPQPIQIVITGCDKQQVGQFAAVVRRVRPPEPYKGKGIRYQGEQVVQKQGKSFVGGEK
jgi:large subunit ribosomal protein L6